MAELRATPMSNPILGLLADRLKKAQQFGAKPFGYENPPVEMLMNLLGVPAVQQTMERMAYGEPLTTGSGMTTKPRPEAIEAAMTLLPASVGLAKATKGLPVGASIKNVGKDVDVGLNEASNFLSAKSKFGEVGGTIRQPDKLSDKPYLQINYAEVQQASRGTGKGKELYKALIDEAESMGLRVFSDSTVEKSAVNVYKSLEKGGYKLKDMTKGSLDDGAVYGSGAEKPAFEISNKQKSAPRQEALDTAQKNAVEYPLAPAGTRYEEFGGELTYMTPDEYLSRVRPLTLDAESLDNIAALKSHVQSGGKLDPLHIYQSGKEDGRHRAYMAKELGIERIPVALHSEANNLGQNIPLDALSLLAEQKRKEITSLLE
jgi:predicted GNAT family acetyltransferase